MLDDSLIRDVIAQGSVGKSVTRRLVQYYQIAADAGADVILNTCSSVGEVVALGRQVVSVPIVRIDEPMAIEAVKTYERIGVIATLSTTLNPTIRLLREQAEKLGRRIAVVDGLAAGAYDALVAGRADEHDALIAGAAASIAPRVDCMVLAQGSMARMESALAAETGKPVLSSPARAVLAIKAMLDAAAR
jgi:glutamate racemase